MAMCPTTLFNRSMSIFTCITLLIVTAILLVFTLKWHVAMIVSDLCNGCTSIPNRYCKRSGFTIQYNDDKTMRSFFSNYCCGTSNDMHFRTKFYLR